MLIFTAVSTIAAEELVIELLLLWGSSILLYGELYWYFIMRKRLMGLLTGTSEDYNTGIYRMVKKQIATEL